MYYKLVIIRGVESVRVPQSQGCGPQSESFIWRRLQLRGPGPICFIYLDFCVFCCSLFDFCV